MVKQKQIFNKISGTQLVQMLTGKSEETEAKYVNKDLAHLVPKIKGNKEELERLKKLFLESYADSMNSCAKKIMDEHFDTESEAYNKLTHMIRSHLPGWTIHVGPRSVKNNVVTYTCHTVSHSKCDETVPKCPWQAQLTCENGKFKFTAIAPFETHLDSCLLVFGRFTTREVASQKGLSFSGRQSLSLVYNCLPVQEATFRKQVNRATNRVVEEAKELEEEELTGCKPDFTLTNLSCDPALLEKVPEETREMVRLLTFLKMKENLHSKMVFEEQENGGSRLSAIHMVYPKGAQMLRTHGDVIYCDSIWSTTVDGDHLLTVVVVDEDNKLQLAATSLTTTECKDSWTSFFAFIKTSVPLFNPKCLVSDGAAYIAESCRVGSGVKPLHIICWWHQRNANKKNFGKHYHIIQMILSLSYSETHEQLERQKQVILDKIQQATGIKVAHVQQQLERQVATSLINLTVFTGGTITNSYCESINACLRNNGANTTCSKMDLIRKLRQFNERAKIKDNRPLNLSKQISDLLEGDVLTSVTNGALRSFSEKVSATMNSCKTQESDGVNTKVLETVHCEVNGVNLEKTNRWLVQWETGKPPQCGCNGLTYAGMPCAHICWVATQNQKRVPLCCFNKRFHSDPHAWGQPWPDLQPTSGAHDVDTRIEICNAIPQEKRLQDNTFMQQVSLQSYFNSQRSCEIQARFQALLQRALIAQQGQPQEIADPFINTLLASMEAQISDFERMVQPQVAVIPHSQLPNTPNSYITTPQQIRQAAAQCRQPPASPCSQSRSQSEK